MGLPPMDARAREAFATLVDEAIVEISGKAKILAVQSALIDALERGRFDSERAHEMFRMAIERAVWDRFGSAGALTTKAIRGYGIVEAIAAKETAMFLAMTEAKDQRAVRRGLLSLMVGK